MHQYPTHSELQNCNDGQLEELCATLREDIISATAENGGHLASSLGAVELCVALHRCFDLSGNDTVFFDVGHQAYAHKLLTQREASFAKLRQLDGCSGFPSQALGAAKAMALQGRPGHVIAVVGDGALSCGIAWEALNNVKAGSHRLIIILNDNQMSISPNKGAIRKCLNRIIAGRFYNRLRSSLSEKKRHGILYRLFRRIEHSLKGIFISDGLLFQEFGLRYFGPIDGNSVSDLCTMFNRLPDGKPILLHVVTRKGQGYRPAEENPEKFHGVNGFVIENGEQLAKSQASSYSNAFAKALDRLAARHDDVVAITAAMSGGTGLKQFKQTFPQRHFDTGIAEGHAVAFASGLAARGLRPIVAMYSTFLQRALDNVYHDVCLNKLPVIFCIDRTGAVPDGPTHHGIYALPFLMQLPNMTVMTPADANEMEAMLEMAYSLRSPVVIRYPRGKCPALPGTEQPLEYGRAVFIRKNANAQLTLWAEGAEIERALIVADELEKRDICANVVNPRFLLPFDAGLARELSAMPQFAMDDYTPGGLLACIQKALSTVAGYTWPANTIIPHGNVEEIRRAQHLTPEEIARDIGARIGKPE